MPPHMTTPPRQADVAADGGNPGSIRAPFGVSWTHRLEFTNRALDAGNTILHDVIGEENSRTGDRGLLVVVDKGVSRGNPDLLEELQGYFGAHDDLPELREIIEADGGEQCKNHGGVVESVLKGIDTNRICRKSTVLVIGGGAMLDAAGYAAATAHRGVRLIRMPSTVLSQCDSGVGVKNGINHFNKKNFLGTFAPPTAVVCDLHLLKSLDDEEWHCGLSEIVKIALLKDPKLFETIEANLDGIRNRMDDPSHGIIERSAKLHLRHITEGGDPFELTEARPLDFGHWSAHKLEQMTGFELRHGEAVAIGVALDMTYSGLVGIVDEGLVRRTLSMLEALGLPTSHAALQRTDELTEGIEEFREHLGGDLTISLVRDVGEPVDVHEIDQPKLRKAVELLLERSSG